MRMPDGSFICDRCGPEGDCGNGGLVDCVVISAMDPVKEGAVINFHFCINTKDEEGKVVRKGCAGKVLSARNLQHYWSTQETE